MHDANKARVNVLGGLTLAHSSNGEVTCLICCMHVNRGQTKSLKSVAILCYLNNISPISFYFERNKLLI